MSRHSVASLLNDAVPSACSPQSSPPHHSSIDVDAQLPPECAPNLTPDADAPILDQHSRQPLRRLDVVAQHENLSAAPTITPDLGVLLDDKSGVNVSDGADDADDEIQIVSANVRHQPAETILLDSDSDDVANPQGPQNPLAASFPSVPLQPHRTDLSADVVECTPVTLPGKALAAPSTCSSCSVRVRTDRPPLSRCKHVLCPTCLLCSVVEGCPKHESNNQPGQPEELAPQPSVLLPECGRLPGGDDAAPKDENPETGDAQPKESDSQSDCAKSEEQTLSVEAFLPQSNNSSQPTIPTPSPETYATLKDAPTPARPRKPSDARALRTLPVCIVPRCGAPMSRSEVMLALSSPLVDDAFAPALQRFYDWADAPENPDTFFGATHISFRCPDLPTPNTAEISQDALHRRTSWLRLLRCGCGDRRKTPGFVLPVAVLRPRRARLCQTPHYTTCPTWRQTGWKT